MGDLRSFDWRSSKVLPCANLCQWMFNKTSWTSVINVMDMAANIYIYIYMYIYILYIHMPIQHYKWRSSGFFLMTNMALWPSRELGNRPDCHMGIAAPRHGNVQRALSQQLDGSARGPQVLTSLSCLSENRDKNAAICSIQISMEILCSILFDLDFPCFSTVKWQELGV